MDLMEHLNALLCAPAADVVKLAQGADPEGLDLGLLLEYEIKPGGGCRVRLLDRGRLLAWLARYGALEAPTGDPEGLWAALEGAAEEVNDDFI